MDGGRILLSGAIHSADSLLILCNLQRKVRYLAIVGSNRVMDGFNRRY